MKHRIVSLRVVGPPGSSFAGFRPAAPSAVPHLGGRAQVCVRERGAALRAFLVLWDLVGALTP